MAKPQRTAQLKKQLKETAKRLDERFNLGVFESTLKRRQKTKALRVAFFNEVEAMVIFMMQLKTHQRNRLSHIQRRN